MPAEVQFPVDWLDPRAGDAATDLDLAVLLVNSYDALADPPDRLRDLRWLRAAYCRQVGHDGHRRRPEGRRTWPHSREPPVRLRAAFEAPRMPDGRPSPQPDDGAGAAPFRRWWPTRRRQARPDWPRRRVREGLAGVQVRLPVAVAQRIAGPRRGESRRVRIRIRAAASSSTAPAPAPAATAADGATTAPPPAHTVGDSPLTSDSGLIGMIIVHSHWKRAMVLGPRTAYRKKVPHALPRRDPFLEPAPRTDRRCSCSPLLAAAPRSSPPPSASRRRGLRTSRIVVPQREPAVVTARS